MKFIFSIILSICFGVTSYPQETYTSKKGSRFFPGHTHIVITLDSNSLHYQLFNHWYSLSYAQYRDITIPLSELTEFNSKNDSLMFEILDNKIKLIDKRYKLHRSIRHQNLCASLDHMRKISFANTLAERYENVMHFHLYERDELELSEEEFKKLVKKRLEEKLK